MAKSQYPNNQTNSSFPVRDRSLFYSDLSFMPSDMKASRLWMAQSLFNAKQNSIQFLDRKKADKYRRLNVMNIDSKEYIELIDPKTPMGGGGNAEYFASDFKDFPIAIHLQNIRRARLDKIPFDNKLQVNEIDKFSKSQRQQEKDRVIHQREFRKLINEINEEIGLPPIKESVSPEEYVRGLKGDDSGQKVDDVSRLMEQLRTKVVDSKDWQLYDRYVYKGEIERAFEMAIDHYLINQNKWRIKSEFFNQDIINFNKACGRWYIDQTTGRGVVEYIDGVTLFTSPFYEKDGSDLLYFYYEKSITFADFLRQFGQTLDNEQIKKVLEQNRTTQGVGVGTDVSDWTSWSGQRRNNCLITIGYFSVLTQEMDSYAEVEINNGVQGYIPKPADWKPEENSGEIKNKAYNVWYSCYYIPPPTDVLSSNNQASWEWQSQFIFNIEKDIDMYRYGVDNRYARPSLIIYKNDLPSCTDIEEGFMPKIRTLWHKFQNCLVQDTNAVVIDWDFMMGILNATDEANNNNPGDPKRPTGSSAVNAGLEQFRMMRQGGIAFMKFRDKNGNYPPGFDPSKFFVNIDTKHLDKAEKLLAQMLQLYQVMQSSLAQSDITGGQAPKPRTPVEGIKATLEAAQEGGWFVEKAVREFLIMYGERVVQMVLNMVKEKDKYNYTKRWDEFRDVIGLAQALMIEGVSELDPEDIGLTVTLEDTTAMREYIFSLANEMSKTHQITYQAAGLVIDTLSTGSWKYAYALLMLSVAEQERQMREQEEIAHQRSLELEQMRLNTALALQGAKDKGKDQNIQTQGAVDAQLQEQLNTGKYNTQAALGEQRKVSKMEENEQKEILKRDTEQQKSFFS